MRNITTHGDGVEYMDNAVSAYARSVASSRLSACLDEQHYVGFIVSAMISAIVTHQLSA